MSRKQNPSCKYHAVTRADGAAGYRHSCADCERARLAAMKHMTITVGARRSCTFTPAPLGARLGNGDLTDRQLEILGLMSAADAAVYHTPLDTAPRAPRKPGPKLGAALKAGDRAMGADDLKSCKRPVAVAIPYLSEGGDRVVAIFGGLTPAQASAAGGWTIPQATADEMKNGDDYKGHGRVVLWPSELQRRGALPICAVESPRTDPATAADVRRACRVTGRGSWSTPGVLAYAWSGIDCRGVASRIPMRIAA